MPQGDSFPSYTFLTCKVVAVPHSHNLLGIECMFLSFTLVKSPHKRIVPSVKQTCSSTIFKLCGKCVCLGFSTIVKISIK